ncbi:MAG: polysaccharide deacetylase family protein [Clostridia bacterium]|nr:polysaccharide deacetylase family protein [Clostridia bacterium]
MKTIFLSKKKLVLICCALLLLVLFGVFGISRGAAETVAEMRLLPIYCVDTQKKYVALTFDAAWGNEDTQQLIDTLKKHNAKATFFLVGSWVDKYPESVRALSKAGHSIQNHSDTHPNMPQLSKEGMRQEITLCNEKIRRITNKTPSLIRPPFGDYSNSLIETVNDLGMYTIQWDVDSLDWKDLSADEIYNRVINKVQNGSIVLFHNAALNTPEALDRILETLTKEGYEFVTVEKLIYKTNYTIDHTGKQFNADNC